MRAQQAKFNGKQQLYASLIT